MRPEDRKLQNGNNLCALLRKFFEGFFRMHDSVKKNVPERRNDLHNIRPERAFVLKLILYNSALVPKTNY